MLLISLLFVWLSLGGIYGDRCSCCQTGPRGPRGFPGPAGPALISIPFATGGEEASLRHRRLDGLNDVAISGFGSYCNLTVNLPLIIIPDDIFRPQCFWSFSKAGRILEISTYFTVTTAIGNGSLGVSTLIEDMNTPGSLFSYSNIIEVDAVDGVTYRLNTITDISFPSEARLGVLFYAQQAPDSDEFVVKGAGGGSLLFELDVGVSS